jgi:hypothetical protein
VQTSTGTPAHPSGGRLLANCTPAGDPGAEPALGLEAFGRDEDPALHRPAGHVEQPRVRAAQGVGGRIGADANHQLATAGDADRHVAMQQERQHAEHRLLGDRVLIGE